MESSLLWPEDPALPKVLARFTDGPKSGLFTDGGSSPNPGPGGWGIVYVLNDEIIAQVSGYEPMTTNNKMELTALIEAYRRAPKDIPLTIHTDSQLCVKSMHEWAPNWERRGWKKKDGEIANLELVKCLFELFRTHKNIELKWVRGHNGWRWNEYADALATQWMRANS